MRYFVAVAEQGSFTRAALALHVSQPTLSQQIRDLERELGVTLLSRGPGGVRPSRAGEVYYERIRLVLAAVDDAARAARRAADGPARLSVGIGVPLPRDVHLPVLSAFAAAHPEVRVAWRELTITDFDTPLTSGEVDVALIRMPLDPERLVWEPLLAEPRGLAVPPGHRLHGRDGATLADVIEEPLPHVAPAVPDGMRRWWQMYAQRNGEAPEFVGEPVSSPYEIFTSVVLHHVVCPGPFAFRTTPLPAGVRILPLTGLPGALVVAARRREDHRELPAAFCALAAELARGLTAH
ncbi:hypothetical protein GCM10018785_16540 [Streptomyces longispororuber]|uniref:HTH lysR-type domain-containing protein n=1 Tax=Streptomyces longispororuber TaxID=68230 RepID=A0A919DID5_9ACTN|nr:hypothetical protein GCM10018785_16540 [Streptomyces longispororuber]